MPRYFFGEGDDLGTCQALSTRNFSELVQHYLLLPTKINRSRSEFLALPKRDRDEAKKKRYLVPCTFQSSPSPRQTGNAVNCNLIFLDIDDPADAKAILADLGTLEQSLPWGFAIYTTASHTPQAPRLRLVINAEEIPVALYPKAVATLAARIGVTANKESKVAVQPMYLPAVFLDQDPDTEHPLILDNRDGPTFNVRDIKDVEDGQPATRATVNPTLDDLDFLRPPVEEITLEIAEEALTALDADVSYPQWVEVAAALKHQFGHNQEQEAFDLFDRWSSKGSKYESPDACRKTWNSLRATPLGRAPVTIRTLLHTARAAGWHSADVQAECFASAQAFLDSASTFSALINEGSKKIASTPLLGQSEEDALINKLVSIAKREFQQNVNATSVRKDVARHKLAMKATKADDSTKKTPPWAKGLVFISSLNVLLRHQNGERYSTEAFDNAYGRRLLPTPEDLMAAGFTRITEAMLMTPKVPPSKYVLNEVKVPVAYACDYHPGQPNETFFVEDGRTYLNTYVRSHPAAKADETGEVAKTFLAHMENLIAEPDYRRTMIDFLAFLVQHPGRKVRWAVLLQGAQGCGKTAIAEMMRSVLGNAHVKTVDASALRGQWNDWATGHQLVTLEEIRVAGQNRHEIMNVLKPLITNTKISISQRFQDNREAPNRTNYLLFTNHHDSLAISNDDRRYFVLKSRLQTREQVLALGGDAYFAKLFDIIANRAAELRHFFETWPISDDFPADSHAPATSYLTDLVETSINDTHSAVRQLIADGENPLVKPDLVSIQQLKTLITLSGCKDASMQYLGNLLREEGFVKATRHVVNGDRQTFWTHLAKWDKSKNIGTEAERRANGEQDPEDIL